MWPKAETEVHSLSTEREKQGKQKITKTQVLETRTKTLMPIQRQEFEK